MQTLDQTLGLGAQIADIERIRQILGDQKLILIGHSWGSFLASLYAAEFPEHVDALILVSPANTLVMPQPEADSDLFASVRAELPPDQQAEFDAFMEEYFDFSGLFEKSEDDLVALNQKFGEYYIDIMDTPIILDNLMADNQIIPLIAVFSGYLGDRVAYYSNKTTYFNFLDPLVTYIDKNYPTSATRECRLHVGLSLTGYISAIVGFERSNIFQNIAIPAPMREQLRNYIRVCLLAIQKHTSWFKRLQKQRAKMEPVIGHLKADHGMDRCRYKGFEGDQINVSLATMGWNLKKWGKHLVAHAC